MAMIEFEDKIKDAKPLSWGERLFLGFLVIMQLYGLYSMGVFVAGLLGLN